MVITILIVLGLCFGSFVGAFVWRLKNNKDWVNDRSVCEHCKHVLAPQDLVPLLSWLALQGKCRYCHRQISWQNPVVELATAVLFVTSYLYWPLGFEAEGITLFIFWLIFLVGFMALILFDIKWMILPNSIVFPLAGLAVLGVLARAITFHGGLSVLYEAFWGVLIGGGLFYALFQASNGKWIGGGDVKLGAVLGLIVGGPAAALLLIFMASVMGSLVAVPLMMTKRLKPTSRLPFGPFLIAAAIVVYLHGASLLSWYQNQLLV
ncbi:MAG: prepilin peptidase [Candidatus Saccharibacteria bacterium]|nr:prepilin peptidase [Candidatus Saccharibacteria bacterium]